MSDSLYDSVVIRRLFTLLMVSGAVVLAVAVTLLIVNIRASKPANDSETTPAAVQPPAMSPSAPPQQPAVVTLGMEDFTAACQAQHGAGAMAKTAPTSDEPPSYWVKC